MILYLIIIQQIVNKEYFTAKNTVVMQCFAILWQIVATYVYHRIWYIGITNNKDVWASHELVEW